MYNWYILLEWDDRNGKSHCVDMLYSKCAKPQRERVIKQWLAPDDRNNVVVTIVREDRLTVTRY